MTTEEARAIIRAVNARTLAFSDPSVEQAIMALDDNDPVFLEAR